MDLKISRYNNFFSLKGILNKSNLYVFLNEFENIFEKTNAITVSIEGIEWMDRHGVEVFAKLQNESILKGKTLSIVGFGYEKLYEHFRTSEMTPNNIEKSPNNVNPDEAAA